MPRKRAHNRRPRDVNHHKGTDGVPTGEAEKQDYDSLPDPTELTTMGAALLRALKEKRKPRDE